MYRSQWLSNYAKFESFSDSLSWGDWLWFKVNLLFLSPAVVASALLVAMGFCAICVRATIEFAAQHLNENSIFVIALWKMAFWSFLTLFFAINAVFVLVF